MRYATISKNYNPLKLKNKLNKKPFKGYSLYENKKGTVTI